MIRADFFIDSLRQAGFGLYSGVPCSYLTPLINTVIESPDIHYIPAANEGDAVAIACGAELGGRRAVAMFQNSGLGNAVSPLTSLTSTFRLPVLLITTWRGQPGGPADEPQHDTMGRITPKLLQLMDIPWEIFPKNEEDVGAALLRAVGHMDTERTPYALVMPHGTVQAATFGTSAGGSLSRCELPSFSHRCVPSEQHSPAPAAYDQDEVLTVVQSNAASTDAIVATTGFTGRALYALGDRDNQFYMVGSMGCASSLALGLSQVCPDRRIIVLDGDGALLMRMGALATIAHQSPPNLVHIVLDNGVHDSTGAQATVTPEMDLVELAAACGYPHARRADDLNMLEAELRDTRRVLKFIHVRTSARTNRKLPRPIVTPAEVASRFRRWLGEPACV